MVNHYYLRAGLYNKLKKLEINRVLLPKEIATISHLCPIYLPVFELVMVLI